MLYSPRLKKAYTFAFLDWQQQLAGNIPREILQKSCLPRNVHIRSLGFKRSQFCGLWEGLRSIFSCEIASYETHSVNCSQLVENLSHVDKDTINRINTKIRCHPKIISARQKHKKWLFSVKFRYIMLIKRVAQTQKGLSYHIPLKDIGLASVAATG